MARLDMSRAASRTAAVVLDSARARFISASSAFTFDRLSSAWRTRSLIHCDHARHNSQRDRCSRNENTRFAVCTLRSRSPIVSLHRRIALIRDLNTRPFRSIRPARSMVAASCALRVMAWMDQHRNAAACDRALRFDRSRAAPRAAVSAFDMVRACLSLSTAASLASVPFHCNQARHSCQRPCCDSRDSILCTVRSWRSVNSSTSRQRRIAAASDRNIRPLKSICPALVVALFLSPRVLSRVAFRIV